MTDFQCSFYVCQLVVAGTSSSGQAAMDIVIGPGPGPGYLGKKGIKRKTQAHETSRFNIPMYLEARRQSIKTRSSM